MTDRDAGTLLVRDAGAVHDTRWIQQRADLPRAHPLRPAHREDPPVPPGLRRRD